MKIQRSIPRIEGEAEGLSHDPNKGKTSLTDEREAEQQRALKNHWKNGKHGTNKLGFLRTKTLIRKSSVVREPTLVNIASPVLVEFNEYLLKCAKIY